MIDYNTNIKLEHTIPDAKDLKEIYYTVQARKDAKELFEKEVYPSLNGGQDYAKKFFNHPINPTKDIKSAKRLFALRDYLESRGYKITFIEIWKTQKDMRECYREYISMKIEWEI